MEFGQLVSYENQEARFKTFFTLKVIYTGCSKKGAILVFSGGPKVSRKKKLLIWNVSNQCTLQFQNAMHRVNHERSNIAVSFEEHPIFPGKIFPDLYTCTSGRQRQTKIKTLVCTIHCENAIGRYSTKEAISLLFHGAPKSSRKKYFYTRTLGEYQQIKIKNQNKDTMRLERAICRVIHKRKNIKNISRRTEKFQK